MLGTPRSNRRYCACIQRVSGVNCSFDWHREDGMWGAWDDHPPDLCKRRRQHQPHHS